MPQWFNVLKKLDPDKQREYYNKRGEGKKYPNFTDRFLVKDEVWAEAELTTHDGYPSILELEELLGRRLTKDDFEIEYYENWAEAHLHPNVLDRITIQGIKEGIQLAANNPGKIWDGFPREDVIDEKAAMVKVDKIHGLDIDFTKMDKYISSIPEGL